jgi:hypothetical protein
MQIYTSTDGNYNTKINTTTTVQVLGKGETLFLLRWDYCFFFLRLTSGKRETKGRESLS